MAGMIALPTGAIAGTLLSATFDASGEDVSRIELEGELDVASAPTLRDLLRVVAPLSVGRLEIDISGLTFIDAAGARVLIEARERDIVGIETVIECCGAGPARRLAELCQLHARLGLEHAGSDSTDEPLARETAA